MKKICVLILSGEILWSIFNPGYSQTSFGNYITANSADQFVSNNIPSSSISFTVPLPWSSFNRSPGIPFGANLWPDTLPHPGKDTLPLPHRNYLRNDDPAYNKRYPLWIPIVEVPITNLVIWSYDKFILNADYADISGETIKNNFKNGWEWDTDDFPTNFSSHPYAGSLYFNTARSNGYNFFQSAPFALGGSLMWELFMENTKPSYNDLINTTITGIFLGEVLYRLSSSILDDRKKGAARVVRETAGALVDPLRGINRLTQGKVTRIVNKEIYQKEPLFLTLSAGARQDNPGTDLGAGNVSALLDLNFTYGDPYEIRFRKPFDYFRLRADLIFGSGSSVVNSVIGDGFLFGKNVDSTRKVQMLIGGFQHYDYWNTDSFQIGTIGFGAGVLSRVPVFRHGNFQNELHLGIVPFGASNAQKVQVGDINSAYHNYTFSGGAEMKFQTALNFKWGQLAAEYYLYWLHTYVGKAGDNILSILRPRITVKIYRSLNIGYEYLWYYRNDYYPSPTPDLHVRTTEQRIYLMLNFENF